MQADWHNLTTPQQQILIVMADRDDPTAPMTGVDIRKSLEELRGTDDLANSYVYPNLDVLEEEGLVERPKQDARSRPNHLTQAGQEVVLEHANTMQRAATHLSGFQTGNEVDDGS